MSTPSAEGAYRSRWGQLGRTLAAIFVVAVLVNYPWELAQAPLYVGLEDFRTTLWHCFVASLGDGLMVLGLFALGCAVWRRHAWFVAPGVRGYLVMMGGGLVQGITVRVTLAMLALVAALHLPTQRAGAAEAEKFDIEKAVTGAKTPADHEAIASHYDREVATVKAQAEEHRKLAEAYRNIGRGRFQMEDHCRRLVQHYESLVAANTALAEAHRQMAQGAAQKKP